MTEPEELPYGELGDLVEDLIPVATRLIEAVRDEGPEAIVGVLHAMPSDVRAKIDHIPGGVHGVLAIVLAGMVSPDATMRQLLGWTTTLYEPVSRGRVGGRRVEPPAERERQRLVAAGVPTDTALVLAHREAVQPPTTRQRMLRVIHGGRESA